MVFKGGWESVSIVYLFFFWDKGKRISISNSILRGRMWEPVEF